MEKSPANPFISRFVIRYVLKEARTGFELRPQSSYGLIGWADAPYCPIAVLFTNRLSIQSIHRTQFSLRLENGEFELPAKHCCMLRRKMFAEMKNKPFLIVCFLPICQIEKTNSSKKAKNSNKNKMVAHTISNIF